MIAYAFVQMVVISYLHTFVTTDCKEELTLLVYVCSFILTVAVLAGDVADAIHTMEFIRLLPTSSEHHLVFDTDEGRI